MFAAIQYKPPKGDVLQALNELETLIEQAAQNGAQFIVLPEMATTGYLWPDRDSLLPFVEPKEGKTFDMLSACAKKYHIWIVCGYAEIETTTEELYNSALIINDKGERICNYRKVLLYDADYSWASAGSERYLIESPFGILTPAICMDLNDNRLIRFLWQNQPTILAFCTNWLDEGGTVIDYWQNRLSYWSGWFIAANTWGPEEDISFCGQSSIFDPAQNPITVAPKSGNHIVYGPLPTK